MLKLASSVRDALVTDDYQTETALIYDAVHGFANALNELDKSQVGEAMLKIN